MGEKGQESLRPGATRTSERWGRRVKRSPHLKSDEERKGGEFKEGTGLGRSFRCAKRATYLRRRLQRNLNKVLKKKKD